MFELAQMANWLEQEFLITKEKDTKQSAIQLIMNIWPSSKFQLPWKEIPSHNKTIYNPIDPEYFAKLKILTALSKNFPSQIKQIVHSIICLTK